MTNKPYVIQKLKDLQTHIKETNDFYDTEVNIIDGIINDINKTL